MLEKYCSREGNPPFGWTTCIGNGLDKLASSPFLSAIEGLTESSVELLQNISRVTCSNIQTIGPRYRGLAVMGGV